MNHGVIKALEYAAMASSFALQFQQTAANINQIVLKAQSENRDVTDDEVATAKAKVDDKRKEWDSL